MLSVASDTAELTWRPETHEAAAEGLSFAPKRTIPWSQHVHAELADDDGGDACQFGAVAGSHLDIDVDKTDDVVSVTCSFDDDGA